MIRLNRPVEDFIRGLNQLTKDTGIIIQGLEDKLYLFQDNELEVLIRYDDETEDYITI